MALNEDERLIFTMTLRAGADAIGVPLSDVQLEQCARYADLLLETNAHTNLTRITAPADMAIKHFVDSLTVLRALPDMKPGATLADVGTGAGFPGMAVAIARPGLALTLIDALAKRIGFLRGVADTLALPDITLVHARAEDVGRDPAQRDRFDVVTARAVAALPTLLEWCGPLARPGGVFVAMKSADISAERDPGDAAAGILRLRLENEITLTLPAVPGDTEEPARRRLLVYRKTGATPARFPRRQAEIKARPLGSP